MKKRPRPTHEQVLLQFALKKGLLHRRELFALGVATIVLTRLVRAGQLERVARGVYSPARMLGGPFRSMAEVALRAPRGVICLLSALRLHEIGTQAPFEVWLALPPGVAPPKLDSVAVRVVRMSGDALRQGIEHRELDGARVPVYGAAKTVADCFKFRNKIGLDVALEALSEGWQEGKVGMDPLWRYAKIDRVANVIRPYLESLP